MSVPPDPHSITPSTPHQRRGVLRYLIWTVASLVAVLALLAAVFVAGVPLPADKLRAPLEGLLSDAFGVPTRIQGPLDLRTGLIAAAKAGTVILVDPSNPAGPPLAKADGVSARIDVLALLRRVVILEEISGEQVEVGIARSADGRINWAPVVATSDGPPPVQFAGIRRLQLSAVTGSFISKPGAEPARWELRDFESSLFGRDPVKARGTLGFSGRTFAFDASTMSLAELIQGPGQTIPIKAAIETSGTHVTVDGAYALAGGTLSANFQIKADDGDAALASIGVQARNSRALNVRGRAQVGANSAQIDELEFRLGETSVAGRVGIDWARPRPAISLDLSGEKVDTRPFLTGAGHARGKTTIEGYVQLLHELATRIDLELKTSVAEFTGLTLPVRDYSLEGRIRDSVLTARSKFDLLRMSGSASIDYSAKAPKRVLAMHLEGKRDAKGPPPKGVQIGTLSVTARDLRADLRGAGDDTRQLVGSATLDFDARDIGLSWSHGARSPTELFLNSARMEIKSKRSAQAQIRGRLGGYPCSVYVSGGTIMSLISGERWPVRLDSSCAGAKLVSRGHVIAKGGETTADLVFNLDANPIGPFAGAIGLAKEANQPFSANGALALTKTRAHVTLKQFRIGRTTGSGKATVDHEGKQPHRIELSLMRVDVGELATLAPAKKESAPVDLLSTDVLPAKFRIPDADLQAEADAVRYGGDVFRKLKLKAEPRDGRVQGARFVFHWQGVALAGELSADLRSERPSIALKVGAEQPDLAAVLESEGLKLPRLRAERIQASAHARGVKLGDLLASATAEAEVFKGRIIKVQQHVPGLPGDAEFSAKLSVTEKQPVKLSARGTVGNTPFEVSIDTEPLEQLVQGKGTLPASVRASLGEIRVEASGNISRERRLSAHVKLSGQRLDRLGRLAAARLPEASPYSAVADLVVVPGSVRASGIDAKFGKSEVLGEVSLNRAGARPAVEARLRAPALHLEDLGLHLLVSHGEKQDAAGTSEESAETKAARDIEQFERSLRALDAKATLNVEALYSEGKHYASLRSSVTLQDAKLHVAIQDMYVGGGKANADLHVDAAASGPRLRLRALTEGFEFGPLVEAFKPKTSLEGTLDLALNATLESLGQPLAGNLDGHINFAVFPRELKIGAADYWGTGLLHMMQRTVDSASESRLNCAVAIFDIKQGLARTEAFFADTTRVRIIGDLQANLVTRELSGRLSPNAKNPALLTVSPSVGVGGTLEAPKVELTPDSLITTPLRLMFPIHAFAFDWLSSSSPAADGSDACRKAFEQAMRVDPKKPPPPAKSSIWPF